MALFLLKINLLLLLTLNITYGLWIEQFSWDLTLQQVDIEEPKQFDPERGMGLFYGGTPGRIGCLDGIIRLTFLY